jgi:hypothetical protein
MFAVLAASGLVAGMLAFALPGTAGAGGCPSGYAVSAASSVDAGTVVDAPANNGNGDGAVCSTPSADGTTIDLIDNSFAEHGSCPPGESGFVQNPASAAPKVDRNGDGFICGKGPLLNPGTAKIVWIDNNVPTT